MDKYETFWRRFFAGLIDALVFLPIGVITVLLTLKGNTVLLIVGTILNHLSFYAYSVYFHWAKGQTVGKQLMDIRVVDQTETRLLTLGQSLMRDSVSIGLEVIGVAFFIYRITSITGFDPLTHDIVDYILDWTAIAWFLLELLTMLTNERRRAVHDFLAGSVVIKEEYWRARPH